MTFRKKAHFNNTKFSKEAIFSNAKFESAVFFGAQFLRLAKFSSAKFLHEGNFFSAKFDAEADFHSSEFCREPDINSQPEEKNYDKARTLFPDMNKYSSKAIFTDAKFSGWVNFTFCRFVGEVRFSKCEFLEKVYFWGAEFLNGPPFSCDTVCFDQTKFIKDAEFVDAVFSAGAVFNNAVFSGNAYFTNCKFLNKADFSFTTFLFQVYFYKCFFKRKVRFHDTIFKEPELVSFTGENLTKISFRNTNVVKVKFPEDARWGEKDQFKIIDDEEIELSMDYLLRIKRISNEINNISFKKLIHLLGIEQVNDLQFIKVNEDVISISESSGKHIKDKIKLEYQLPAHHDITIEHYYDITIKLDKNNQASLKIDGHCISDYKFSWIEDRDYLYIYLRSAGSKNLSTVKSIYRNLRENYEFRLRFDEAWKIFHKRNGTEEKI